MSKDKKAMQLGMNPSTASGRLVKDTLWRFVVQVGEDSCFHCGEKMTRETFSIEHKVPWLGGDDPVSLFFDQENISFSHLSCNTREARRPHKVHASDRDRIIHNQEKRKERRIYCPDARRERYDRLGT